MKVLVTGASGFIGQKLCERLLTDGHSVTIAIRDLGQKSVFHDSVRAFEIPTIDENTDWSLALNGVDVVFHLAARVHVMHETATDPLKEYLKTNADGTENLAKQAEKNGIKKFIFLSTIGVNGDATGAEPFTEFDNPAPHNPYSISKKIAEERLIQIAKKQTMDIVIIRAPLVYGKGNRGNFIALINAVQKEYPLPLDSIHNRKSFLYVGNLIDALKTCMDHPRARGIYLVCDEEIVSTADLIRKVANKLGKQARLFSFPYFLIELAAKVTGNTLALEKLTNSLTVDSSKIRYELNWNPPFSIDEGLREISQDI